MWVDSHCHLDAAEFAADAQPQRALARSAGVCHCVIPAVEVGNFEAVRALAHRTEDSYCLGIHPLYVPQASEDDLRTLDAALERLRDDPRLVAVGEIGLDFFVSALTTPDMAAKQEYFYQAQLRLARRYGLPVVLHVRRSADRVLKYLREARALGAGAGSGAPLGGIAHAFNGSDVQADAFVQLGFKLGFGGAMTYPRATRLRQLAQTLPLDALVLETDAPDIPPQWLYRNAEQRSAGQPQGRNAPAELPRIAGVLAELRGIAAALLARATTENVCQALPRVRSLLL